MLPNMSEAASRPPCSMAKPVQYHHKEGSVSHVVAYLRTGFLYRAEVD